MITIHRRRGHCSPLTHAALLVTIGMVSWAPRLAAYPVHKGEYAFLREMPDAARVVADITGEDQLDTAVRRHAALVLLLELVSVSADGSGKLPWPPREIALRRAYAAALPDLQEIGAASDSSEALWARSRQLQADGGFTRPLLNRYFSKPALGELDPFVSGFETRLRWLSALEAVRKSPAGGNPQVELAVTLWRPRFFGIGTLFGTLFLVGLLGELKGFRLNGAHPPGLSAGFRRYTVHTVTGIARSPSTAIENRTTVYGNADYVRSSTESVLHAQFFIAHSGGEQSVQLVNVNLPLREGHRVSAVWAVRRGRERGPYIMFRNHSTGDRVEIKSAVREMLRPRVWPLPMLLISLGALTLYGWSSARSAQLDDGQTAAAVAVCAIIGWFIGRAIVGRLRARRFIKRDLSQLAATLDVQAQGVIGNADAWVSGA